MNEKKIPTCTYTAPIGAPSLDAKPWEHQHHCGMWLPEPRTRTPHAPPFDGSVPCAFCPEPVRNLYAVAHNLVVGGGDTTIGDLRAAVEMYKPLAEAHFADSMHAIGMVDRQP